LKESYGSHSHGFDLHWLACIAGASCAVFPRVKSECAAKPRTLLDSIKRQFGATGMIVCPGQSGTAQISGRQDIVTTAAHVFYDRNCRPIPIDQCTFTPIFSSKAYKLKIADSFIGPCRYPIDAGMA
jgi:hypothetical protein